jgi:hypothetical protein
MIRRCLVIVTIASLLIAGRASAAGDRAGSISGVVLDPSGKFVSGLALRIEKPSRISIKPPGGNLKKKAAELLQSTKPVTPPIATATTDADGRFSMPNVPAGSYRIVGGNNSLGWVLQNISVEPGKDAKLELKLVPPKK